MCAVYTWFCFDAKVTEVGAIGVPRTCRSGATIARSGSLWLRSLHYVWFRSLEISRSGVARTGLDIRAIKGRILMKAKLLLDSV